MTSRRRKIEAAMRLAEGATTEGEQTAALEAVKRLQSVTDEAQQFDSFRDYLRTGSMNDLAEAVGPDTCDCGNRHPAFTTCPRTDEHQRIAEEIRRRFPRGARCFYNKWAFARNCPGTVTGYAKDWNWVRIKFDHLKNVRSVPIYSAKGWHLFTEEIDRQRLREMDIRGGADGLEDISEGIEAAAAAMGRAAPEFAAFAESIMDSL